MEVGIPIQLTTLVEGNSGAERFRLNPNIWAEMQSADRLQKSKVAVISVAGAFRKGKSFLLNFFFRFLKAASRGDSSQWLRSDESLSSGFHWRSGSERDTTGILIWSEPFFLRKPDGEEVGVLLMDTQGTFDHQSSQQDCTSIFAFSTLLSSVQIFNISQNIQETDLQHLRLFIEFAAIASDSQDSVLQHLWFLIRDWQCPDEYEFGMTGGQKYLDKVLKCDPNIPMENLELRQGIRKFFGETFCCLMPHPGFAVIRKDFQGELSKINPEFLAELDKLAICIFSPENLVSKAINGRELTGSELIAFAEVYYEAFRSGKLPSSRTILAATVDLTNFTVSKASRELFDQKVVSCVDPATALADEEIDGILTMAMQEALVYFDKNCMQRSSEATVDCRAALEEELHRQSKHHRVMNQLRSDKIAEEERNQMLADDIESLQKDNEEAARRMVEMEKTFQASMRELSQGVASKDEFEEKLLKESVKHQFEQWKLQQENQKLLVTLQQLKKKANEEMLEEQRKSMEERLTPVKRRAEEEFQQHAELMLSSAELKEGYIAEIEHYRRNDRRMLATNEENGRSVGQAGVNWRTEDPPSGLPNPKCRQQ